MPSGPSQTAVLVSTVCTALITAAKFIAAGFTGSAAMAAEGTHSLIDTGNSALLYLGLR